MSLTIKVKPGVPRQMNADDLPTLDEYTRRIDRVLSRTRGVSLFDLPDVPVAAWWSDRLRPIHAANKALRLAGADLY